MSLLVRRKREASLEKEKATLAETSWIVIPACAKKDGDEPAIVAGENYSP